MTLEEMRYVVKSARHPACQGFVLTEEVSITTSQRDALLLALDVVDALVKLDESEEDVDVERYDAELCENKRRFLEAIEKL